MNKSLAESRQNIDWRKNCLNLIRLIAAVSVMYGHVKLHLQVQTPLLLDKFLEFFFGVPIFFSMSGYLIWNSLGKNGV